jgi:hypothetical protein
MNYLPQKTIKYKTYIKTALIEALKPVFQNHVDAKLQNTKVIIDFPKERQEFPAVIVQFYEREIKNAGVGHEEIFQNEDGKIYKFKHYIYNGDIEFSINALSSLDRDLIADTIVQTIAMGDLSDYTNNFFNRIYPPNPEFIPDSAGHYININSDKINGLNENTNKVPWQSEDDLIYTTSYRVNVLGEFYSLPSDMPFEYVSKVFLYPYVGGIEPVPKID